MALIGVVTLPLLAAFLCWIPPFRRAAWIISVVCLCLGLRSGPRCGRGKCISHLARRWHSQAGSKRTRLSALMLVLVSFVCAMAVLFARRLHATRQEAIAPAMVVLLQYESVCFRSDCDSGTGRSQSCLGRRRTDHPFRNSLGCLRKNRRAHWRRPGNIPMLTIIGAPISLLGFLVLFWAYRAAAATRARKHG